MIVKYKFHTLLIIPITGEEVVDVSVLLDVSRLVTNMIVRVDGHVHVDHSVTTVRGEELIAAAMMNSVRIVKNNLFFARQFNGHH